MLQNKKYKNVIFVLAVLLIASIGFGIYNKLENSKIISFLNTEKTEITADLAKMIKQYDTAIKNNSALTEDLKEAKATVITLKDSITATKKADYKLIKYLRNRVFSLQKLNKRLFYLADSTKKANTLLEQALDSSEVLLGNQEESLKLLKEQNLKLNNNLKKASALELYALSATGIKLKTNGKLVITTRTSRLNRIRVCLRIAKNVLAQKGKRDIYIQVFNPSGKLLGKNENFNLNGKILKYSDKTSFFYQNINTKICILAPIKSKRDIIKGTYKIKVYSEDRLLGELDLYLK